MNHFKTHFLRNRLHQYALLIRLDRPIGIYLLLWPTLWALWVSAQGIPSLKLLIIFSLGVLCMRSAGCAINDYADRHIDPHVTRTQLRPLATRQIAPWEAVMVAGLLSIIAFCLVLLTDIKTIALAFVGAGITIVYPFCKRVTFFPQVVLGAAFAWSIPMAFSAQHQGLLIHQMPATCWLLYLSTLIWTIAYDTSYALCDREDDKKIGVKSTAIFFGGYTQIVIATLQILCLLPLLLLGKLLRLNHFFYIGLVLALLCFIYQQILINRKESAYYLAAFKNNNWVGLIIFMGVGLSFI